jgi:hypothetical protein
MTATATPATTPAPAPTSARSRAHRRAALRHILPALAELAWLHRVVGYDWLTKIHWARVCQPGAGAATVERSWLRALTRARALGLPLEVERRPGGGYEDSGHSGRRQIEHRGGWHVAVRPLWSMMDVQRIAEREGVL